ncbi:hypothetical protein FACS1894208_00830 [Clostridia bacterium]|nr:hypothetical protein FACS1894208_00830 [Clostridia bacterium]
MAKAIRITDGGMFCGNLSDREISRILKIRALSGAPALTREIYDFPRNLREEARSSNLSAYDFAVKENILDNYIGRLRDYQSVGAAFLYASPRSMLGDDAGIGKTPQVCGLLNLLRKFGHNKRVLVAAEFSAVGQIAAEIERFTGLRVVVLQSLSAKMRVQTKRFYLTRALEVEKPAEDSVNFDVLVISHSTLRSDEFFTWFSRVVHEFETFILDESYVVKTPDTAISTYTRSLCAKIPRVHFLNATVFETRLIEVINQFNLCYPGLLPPKSWIERKFCNYQNKTFPIRGGGGRLGSARELVSYKNQDVFRRALALVYLTRKKKDVKLCDTDRFYRTYVIQQTRAQKAAIREGYRYFEILNCPSLCPDAGIPNEITTVPKLQRLVDLITEDFEGQSVMVYAWHLEIQDTIKRILAGRGRKVAVLNGSTGNRDEIRDGFNEGLYDVLVTNIKRSLNLHGGDVCIFYSVETNPASIEQLAGRIDRNVDSASKTFVLLAYEGEEANFFIDTVAQRTADSRDLTSVASETVLKFGELLTDAVRT